MNFKNFIKEISALIKDRLPGEAAQLKLSPASRNGMMKEGKELKKAGRAAVLILFYPDENRVMLPFIKRPEYEGVHSGQVAFPGGRFEAGDANMAHTALRETEEEIGVKMNSVKLIGMLSELYIPPSNYLVRPVVGYLESKPLFKLQPSEVDYLLEIDLYELLHEKALTTKQVMTSLQREMPVPCFYVQNHIIWGATAMILSELIELLKKGGFEA